MYYDWLKYEDIEKSPYPNLLAELKESGYSIARLSECMTGHTCAEDDPNVWSKLKGESPFLAAEVVSLAELFKMEPKYLFGSKLERVGGTPCAAQHWKQKKEPQDIAPLFRKVAAMLPLDALEEMEGILRSGKESPALMSALAIIHEEMEKRRP